MVLSAKRSQQPLEARRGKQQEDCILNRVPCTCMQSPHLGSGGCRIAVFKATLASIVRT